MLYIQSDHAYVVYSILFCSIGSVKVKEQVLEASAREKAQRGMWCAAKIFTIQGNTTP